LEWQALDGGYQLLFLLICTVHAELQALAYSVCKTGCMQVTVFLQSARAQVASSQQPPGPCSKLSVNSGHAGRLRRPQAGVEHVRMHVHRWLGHTQSRKALRLWVLLEYSSSVWVCWAPGVGLAVLQPPLVYKLFSWSWRTGNLAHLRLCVHHMPVCTVQLGCGVVTTVERVELSLLLPALTVSCLKAVDVLPPLVSGCTPHQHHWHPSISVVVYMQLSWGGLTGPAVVCVDCSLQTWAAAAVGPRPTVVHSTVAVVVVR
jgi:hypothetical protein